MNYLAHFLLSFDDDDLLAGQFLTDAYKGNKYKKLPSRIAMGVMLHRYIDSYTDSHQQILEMRKIVRPVLGLWSSPALDVLCDHLLTRHWEKFAANKSRPTFILDVYSTLQRYDNFFNDEMRLVFQSMKKHDWLNAYSTTSGMQRAFSGMSSRLPQAQNLQKAMNVFMANEEQMEQAFLKFYPELILNSEQKMESFEDL
ncbi:MAG: acyl carrier protein phosphodiesterase [Flavobacteriales bacterium]|nr:acyl carrier protein phosphodiesterase [Flavobacteriales bacterium]